MKGFTRRQLVKGGVAAPATTALLGIPGMAALAQSGASRITPAQTSLRERMLLDFGWRFHFGHADDSSKDFGFGAARDDRRESGGEDSTAADHRDPPKAWSRRTRPL